MARQDPLTLLLWNGARDAERAKAAFVAYAAS